MPERGLSDCPLEQEDLIGQIDRVTMQQVDLELRRAAFLDDRIDLEILPFGELVDVVDDLLILVDGAEAYRDPALRALIAVSRHTADEIQEHYGPLAVPITVIPNAVDAERFAPRPEAPAAAPRRP